MVKSFNSKNFIGFLTIFLSTVISYAFVLNNDFLGDDVSRVAGNSELKSLISAVTGELGDRPLLMVMMWLESTVLNFGPVGMRLVGVLLHSIVAWQIFQVILETQAIENEEVEKPAFLMALVFALHPLCNQTLNIIIQHAVILAALTGLLCFKYYLKFLRSGQKRYLAYALVNLAIGQLFKPIVSFLPVFLLFYLALSGQFKRRNVLSILPFFLTLLIPVFFYMYFQRNNQAGYSSTPMSYFLIQVEVIFTYLRLMLVPYGLQYSYDFLPNANLLMNPGWIYFALHGLIIYLCYKWLSRSLAFIFLIGMYCSFLPESSFFPIIHTAFEHRAYLPLMFLILAVGSYLIQSGHYRKIKPVVMLMILGAYLVLNQIRNFQIKPELNWIQHTLENSDTDHTFNISFTLRLYDQGRKQVALKMVEHYRQKYADYIQYKVLFEVLNHQENPLAGRENIPRLAALARQAWDGITPRRIANKVLYAYLERKDATLEDLILLEDTLSMQMRIFFQSHMTWGFVETRSVYPQVVSRLLEDKEQLKNSGHHLLILKMRTILVHYYKQQDLTIRDEVKAELIKDPANPQLIRLNEMLI